MISLRAYLTRGLIKSQSPNFKQIEKQVVRAGKDLHTCTLVIKQDPEWASTMAYQSMLRAGRALLFSIGYLPADGQQHKTVVEITGKILGKEFTSVLKQFDKMRKRRNVFFYDSEDAHNFTEAERGLATARNLLENIKKKIRSLNPQQYFQF